MIAQGYIPSKNELSQGAFEAGRDGVELVPYNEVVRHYFVIESGHASPDVSL